MTRPPRPVRANGLPARAGGRKAKGPVGAVAPARPGAGQVNAAIVDGPDDTEVLLARALETADLWRGLADAAAAAGVKPDQLRIVIKPQLDAFAPGSPAASDPALVECLIDLLHDSGFGDVAVVAARDSSALWAENRDVEVLADLLGYRFSTSKGRAYEIIDLGADLVPGAFPQGTLLNGSGLSSAWTQAHYRIVVAKNRTDEQNGYALCLDCLLGVLPLEDKDYYYRHRFDAGAVVVELLNAAPVQFAIVDAIVSAHGSAGARAPATIATGTLIASRDIVLCDYAGAVKMGLDPYASAINAKALRAIGLPERFRIDGNLAPYANWRNVHPLIIDSTRKREAWVGASRTLRPWLQSLDRDLFPFRNAINDRINGALAPYFAKPDADAAGFWALVYGNYCLGGMHRYLEAYRTLLNKDELRRREAPLGLDLTKFSPLDYERVADELMPIYDLVTSKPVSEDGLRWCYLDEAVAFEFARPIPLPFDEFVAKVDITRTIQFMNDYIGGTAVPIARDAAGRVTHQAERNLYLPQPNYLVLYQGDVIDVTKLEYATYEAGECRMFWKTIKSENGSARFDDGIVSFRRDGADTHVSVCGRQLFTLPLFWQAVDLDLAPELKAALVTDAYTTFFRRTMANLEAVAEGREIRVGCPWHDPGAGQGTEIFPVERLTEVLNRFKDKFGDDWQRDIQGLLPLRRSKSKTAPVVVDAEGFRHFRPSAAGPIETAPQDEGAAFAGIKQMFGELFNVWRDVSDALRKDAEMEGGGGRRSGR